ncbi:hypothetical protein NKI38_29535 [Mesorhizobium sp. M0621]|uniref:hypothetical protein n=1 Tax=Mesorhizobium sp. M0621 TaxID=2956974 RepID=UPI0033370424
MSEHLLLAPLLESYFRGRLTKQRNATPATVASYRDALRMLILFAAARLRKKPHSKSLIETSFSLFSTNSRRSGTVPSPRATPAWPRSDLSSTTSLPPTRRPSASPNAC